LRHGWELEAGYAVRVVSAGFSDLMVVDGEGARSAELRNVRDDAAEGQGRPVSGLG